MIFFFEMAPVSKGRPRMTRRGHAFTPQKTRDFESALKKQMKLVHPDPPLVNPLKVSMWFLLARPKTVKRNMVTTRPDIDNYIKAVLDAGNGILWSDDAIVCALDAVKLYSPNGRPSIVVSIQEYTLEDMNKISAIPR